MEAEAINLDCDPLAVSETGASGSFHTSLQSVLYMINDSGF